MTTVSEMLGYGLIVTLVGMGMCFIVLIGLSYMLNGLKVISNRGTAEKKSNIVEVKNVETPPEVRNETAEVMIETAEDEGELVAVISAALATFMGSESNLVVKSINRVEGSTPVWARVGRQEQMYNRL